MASFLAGSGVVGAVAGSTGCRASDGVCAYSSEGFPMFSTRMAKHLLSFGSGGLCAGLIGNGLGG